MASMWVTPARNGNNPRLDSSRCTTVHCGFCSLNLKVSRAAPFGLGEVPQSRPGHTGTLAIQARSRRWSRPAFGDPASICNRDRGCQNIVLAAPGAPRGFSKMGREVPAFNYCRSKGVAKLVPAKALPVLSHCRRPCTRWQYLKLSMQTRPFAIRAHPQSGGLSTCFEPKTA